MSEFEENHMRKAIFSLLIALTLMVPFSCYGANANYIENPEIWLENDKVLTAEIADQLLDGYFQYYADSADHTFYGHISHSGEIDESSEVYVGLQSDEINIEFDDNGLFDSDFEAQLAYQNGKNEVYFSVDFKSKEIRNNTDSLRITIRIDGIVYSVCDYIPIDLKVPEKTTKAKAKNTTAKQSKENTDKQTTSKSSASSNSKKETTTKFKYVYEKTTSAQEESETEEYYNSGEIVSKSESDSLNSGTELSLTSKILFAVAGVLVVTGISFLIHAGFSKNKSKDDDS